MITIFVPPFFLMILQIFWNTFVLIGSWLPCKIIVDIGIQPWILLNNIGEDLFVIWKLSFQVFDISQINIILESIGLQAFSKCSLIIAKHIINLWHSWSITSINELPCRFMQTNNACITLTFISLFLKTMRAQETVTIKYESTDFFVAFLTFISVLGILVHKKDINIED